MVDDPYTKAQEIRKSLEAVDPELDAINRIADSQEGFGLNPAGQEVWAGRRCCWLVVQQLQVDARTHRVPFRRTCPAPGCERTWEMRVEASTWRGEHGLS